MSRADYDKGYATSRAHHGSDRNPGNTQESIDDWNEGWADGEADRAEIRRKGQDESTVKHGSNYKRGKKENQMTKTQNAEETATKTQNEAFQRGQARAVQNISNTMAKAGVAK